jgi:hypothetical protein
MLGREADESGHSHSAAPVMRAAAPTPTKTSVQFASLRCDEYAFSSCRQPFGIGIPAHIESGAPEVMALAALRSLSTWLKK